ncbi:hypothetical protein AMECASPLE_027693 [Ameca splendens]|uniref:Uncharacterized protein n=1 Tax=Ameca splendens TaxID=208324 RepID=A0ABV0ZQQ4_9TELE
MGKRWGTTWTAFKKEDSSFDEEKPAIIMRFVNCKHKSALLKPGTGKNTELLDIKL